MNRIPHLPCDIPDVETVEKFPKTLSGIYFSHGRFSLCVNSDNNLVFIT